MKNKFANIFYQICSILTIITLNVYPFMPLAVLNSPKTAYAANPSVTLTQCENGKYTSPEQCTGNNWITGSVNEQKSHYKEGDSLPYRFVMENLLPGSHSLIIEWDTTKGGKHAIDYLTSYNQTETLANPCSGVTGCDKTVFDTEPVPVESHFNPLSGSQIPGVFTLFNGDITSLSSYSVSGSYLGDSSTRITINFTTSNSNVVLAVGGHIASQINWGLGSSANSISGASYHMRVIGLDGPGGNQDRSLSAGAVLLPPTINTQVSDSNIYSGQSVYDTATLSGNNGTVSGTVNFYICGPTPTAAGCYPGGTQVGSSVVINNNQAVSSGINPAQSGYYCFRAEYTPDINAGYSPIYHTNNSTECFFVNQTSSITITKDANPNDSQNFTFVTTGTGLSNFSLDDDSDPALSNTKSFTGLLPGTYTISENETSGWKLNNISCLLNGQEVGFVEGNKVTLNVSAGNNISCTFKNDKLPKLKVVKEVKNDNGGLLEVKDFPLLVNTVSVQSGVQNTFEPGNYKISEIGNTGYKATYSGDCDENGNINLNYGDDKTCTITNDDVAPSLTLVKKVVNDDDGHSSPLAWTLSANGPAPISGAGGVTSDNTFKQGTYTLSETEGPDGYESLGWVCEGSGLQSGNQITLKLGESSICTITNDDKDNIPAISVVKTANVDSVPETGADVLFTFSVENLSLVESVTINNLFDSVFGNLAGNTLCQVGTTLAIGQSCQFTTTQWIEGDYSGSPHVNTFTATANDDEGNNVSDSDDESINFTNVPPAVEVTKTPSLSSVPESGAFVDFTFTVKNISSKESVTIKSLSDSIYGTLSGDEDCKVGTVLPVGSNCQFTINKWVEGNYSGENHNNEFTAVVEDNDGSQASDDDDAVIDFTNDLPSVEVTKTAGSTSIPETGGDVLFTFVVKNTSEKEDVDIVSLSDSVFGLLSGDADCKVGTTLVPNASCKFSLTKWLSGDFAGSDHYNVFTAHAKDNDGTDVSDSDDETVVFSDVLPDISVNKTADPLYIPETGGSVKFKYEIRNNGSEAVSITALSDDKFGQLTGSNNCKVGTSLAVGSFCYFEKTFTLPPGSAGSSHTNTFTAVASDDDGNSTTATDDATVTYVGGYLQITPLTATNSVNDPHTFTATIMENTGTGYIAAVGESVTFSLLNNTFGAEFVGGVNTCTTDSNGQCSITINSKNPGSVNIHASSNIGVLSYTLIRQTDGILGSSLDATKIYVAGKIIIEKQTLPDGAIDTFEFNPSWGNSFSLADGQKNDSSWLPLGAYSVSEANLSGWDLTGASCVSSLGDNETIDSINLNSSETVTCSFTNTKRGHIIIEKDARPDSNTDFTFTNNFGNSNPNEFQLRDDHTVGLPSRDFEVKPGTYQVSEIPLIGWKSPESVSCSNGSTADSIKVSAGETVKCTFINEKLAKITLVKNTVGGNGTFEFQMTGQGLPSTTQVTTVNNTGNQVFEYLDPDKTYSITENTLEGWNLTASSCTGTNIPEQITPNRGEEIICTFENTKKGSVNIIKYHDLNENGIQDENEPGIPNWLLNVSGKNIYPALITGNNGEVLLENVLPGEYKLSEELQEGWIQTNMSCLDNREVNLYRINNSNNYSFNVNPGEAVNCFVGNKFIVPELIITKTNNKIGVDLYPGDEVTYTITVEAKNGRVTDVKIVDLLPQGINYRNGSWQAISSLRGNLKDLSLIMEPKYLLTGIWSLGEMQQGEIITLSYIADISKNVLAGVYKDVAWADGKSLIGSRVIAYAGTPGRLSDNFVGTDISVLGKVLGLNYNSEKEVLGLTVLPNTGTQLIWLFSEVILIVTGSIFIYLSFRLRRNNA